MGDDLDPFGRKKDENPLASLGWHGDESTSTVEAEPEPEPEPEREREREAEPVASFGTADEPTQSRPRTPASLAEPDAGAAHWRSPQGHDHAQPSAPGQRKPVGRLVRAVIMLGVAVAILGGLISVLVGEGVERAERFADEFVQPPIPVPAVPRADEDGSRTQGKRADRPARGVTGNSLLRPAAFRRALALLRTGGHGRLMNLRVAPERIDATTVTRDGRLRLLQIVPGGALNILQTTGGFAGARTMTLRGIDAGAPNRLTRAAAARLGQPTSRVNYLVLSEFAGARQWNVYFKGGEIFSADARGRITRRIS